MPEDIKPKKKEIKRTPKQKDAKPVQPSPPVEMKTLAEPAKVEAAPSGDQVEAAPVMVPTKRSKEELRAISRLRQELKYMLSDLTELPDLEKVFTLMQALTPVDEVSALKADIVAALIDFEDVDELGAVMDTINKLLSEEKKN